MKNFENLVKSCGVFGILFMGGCTVSPPVIDPSVPLISNDYTAQYQATKLPDQINQVLTSTPSSGMALPYLDGTLITKDEFYSALGEHCYHLSFTTTIINEEKRIACEDKKGEWKLLDNMRGTDVQPSVVIKGDKR